MLFAGGFRYDDRIYRPDLALIAKDFSHWFIVEVELVTHSFEGHVLPQVRSFQYGEFQPDCFASLARSGVVTHAQAQTLLHFVPRSVAVIANKWNPEWFAGLNALQVQLVSISAFRSTTGQEAFEINGKLEAFVAHLGWGRYVAVDRSLVFPKDLSLPDGEVQISDPAGGLGSWIIRRDGKFAWVVKSVGTPDLPDDAYVQLIRTARGGLTIRRPVLPRLMTG